jgi:hypothetical protein
MRSQVSRSARAAAGVVLCAALFFAIDALPQEYDNAAKRKAYAEVQAKFAEATARAGRLFAEKKWAEARAADDEVLKLARRGESLADGERSSDSDDSSSESKTARERAIACAMNLQDYEDAVRRATPFQRTADRFGGERFAWPTENNGVEKGPLEELDRLEKFRASLETIAGKLPAGAGQTSKNLTNARIALDLDLMRLLDPDVIPERADGGWATRYPDVQWWVNWLKGRSETDKREEDEAWWIEQSVPLSADGKAVVRQAPAEYQPALPRAAKILFLVNEVQRLDASPNRDGKAQALLHRADIARRLYGPGKDESWRAGDFGYRMYQRPTFHKKRGRRDVKEFWQLDDDEARSLFDGRLRVARLPDSENPLAIWARIEKECPNSQEVAEAIYQRGFYYQNLLQFSKADAEYHRLIARSPQARRAASARKQISVIEQPGVLLGSTGQYLAGTKPKLWFACRETAKVEFVARRFDVIGYLKNRLETGAMWRIAFVQHQPFFGRDERDPEAERARAQFAGAEVAKWSEATPRTERVATRTTQAPLGEIGAYVVEARAANSEEVSSALVIVTETAIVQKSLPKKTLLWVVNARTGRPLAGQKVTAYVEVRKRGEDPREARSNHVTDQEGLLVLDGPKFFSNFAFLETQRPRDLYLPDPGGP